LDEKVKKTKNSLKTGRHEEILREPEKQLRMALIILEVKKDCIIYERNQERVL
jgi:hypothetical protein